MKTPEDEAFDDLARRQGDWGGGYPAKKAMAADKLQEPVTEREALEIALDYVLRTTYWTEGRDRHDTLKAIKEALAQPWPDLTKRDRESYQKGHNDGVAHHKKSVKAAQPAQEPVCDKDPQGCWNVRCQLGKQCKNLAQPAQPQQDESDLITIAYQSGFYDGKKAALAQPAQEPVALVIDGVLVKSALPEKYTGHLYTTPPQREPLTDGQKRELIKKSELWDMHVHIGWYSAPSKSFVEKAIQLISEIEAAHDIKEKNND